MTSALPHDSVRHRRLPARVGRSSRLRRCRSGSLRELADDCRELWGRAEGQPVRCSRDRDQLFRTDGAGDTFRPCRAGNPVLAAAYHQTPVLLQLQQPVFDVGLEHQPQRAPHAQDPGTKVVTTSDGRECQWFSK